MLRLRWFGLMAFMGDEMLMVPPLITVAIFFWGGDFKVKIKKFHHINAILYVFGKSRRLHDHNSHSFLTQ